MDIELDKTYDLNIKQLELDLKEIIIPTLDVFTENLLKNN